MKIETIDLTLIVVSFNTQRLTLGCLQSLYEQTNGLPMEVIVVDNASQDVSAEAISKHFPQVHLIRLDKNIGFGPANNLAAKHAKGEWLLLLNPDTVILDGAIQKLYFFAKEHPEAGIFGGRTFFKDGKLNPTFCWNKPTLWSTFCSGIGLSAIFKSSPIFDPENIGSRGVDIPHEVDIVSGCFFLIKKEIWDNLGGFNPDFFMYGEETDLCLRAGKKEIKCMINPNATIVHYGGASGKIRSEKKIRLFKAKALLFKNHWNKVSAQLGVFMLDGKVFIRMVIFALLQVIKPSKHNDYVMWRNIWKYRGEWQNILR
ncbi:MAG: glycosyltransferase family 2 protein [Phycisphaerae bacterium]